LLDRPSSHDALEILKRDPAAEFSAPNPSQTYLKFQDWPI